MAIYKAICLLSLSFLPFAKAKNHFSLSLWHFVGSQLLSSILYSPSHFLTIVFISVIASRSNMISEDLSC